MTASVEAFAELGALCHEEGALAEGLELLAHRLDDGTLARCLDCVTRRLRTMGKTKPTKKPTTKPATTKVAERVRKALHGDGVQPVQPPLIPLSPAERDEMLKALPKIVGELERAESEDAADAADRRKNRKRLRLKMENAARQIMDSGR